MATKPNGRKSKATNSFGPELVWEYPCNAPAILRPRMAPDERAWHLIELGIPAATAAELLADAPSVMNHAAIVAIANDWLEAHGQPTIIPDPRPTVPRPPQWATPEELRQHCQKLRNDWLEADPNDNAHCHFAHSYLEDLLRAMRAMPDRSAPPPMLHVATIEDALQAVDAVVRWCDENKNAKVDRPEEVLHDAEAIDRGVAPRNEWIMQQYDAHGTDTYHKPAKIYTKWKAMTATERASICPDSPNKISKATVDQVVKLARKERNCQDLAKPKRTPRKKT
ncbi:MAG: hypothetical protein ABFC77_11145 [Thermoguttaceae bacterium]